MPVRVVIVDDAPRTLDNLKKLLAFEPDVEVAGTALSAQSGIEEARRLQPDLILMDVNLPDLDGISATEILTAELPTIPIVIVSVQDDKEYLRRAMQAGAREYLVKPFSADELISAIRRVTHLEARKREQHAARVAKPAPPPQAPPRPAPPAPPASVADALPPPAPADLAPSVTAQITRTDIASAIAARAAAAAQAPAPAAPAPLVPPAAPPAVPAPPAPPALEPPVVAAPAPFPAPAGPAGPIAPAPQSRPELPAPPPNAAAPLPPWLTPPASPPVQPAPPPPQPQAPVPPAAPARDPAPAPPPMPPAAQATVEAPAVQPQAPAPVAPAPPPPAASAPAPAPAAAPPVAQAPAPVPAPAPAPPPAAPAARRYTHGVTTLLFSGKGGVGKSVLAINLAAALAKETGGQVALVDLNLQFGDIEVLLGLDSAGSIVDVAQAYPNVDAPFIGSLMAEVAGIRVLTGPRSPELADLVRVEHVRATLDILRQAFDHVVIDCQTHLDDRTLDALECADHIILLTDLNIPSIKDAKLAFNLFETLHISRERIFLVLNRSNAPSNVAVSQLEANLRCPVSVEIPSEGKLVLASIQKAAPFVLMYPDAPISQKVREVVGCLVPLARPAEPGAKAHGKRKLFGRAGG